MSGRGTTTRRSKRPGRSNAGSSTSGRLVAAIRMTPSLDSKPSISTSKRLGSVRVRRVRHPNQLHGDGRPRQFINKMMHGAFFLPCSRGRERGLRRRPQTSPRSPNRKSRRTARWLRLHCASQQRLTRAWRAYQQHTLGDAPAQLLEFLRVFQEIDNLLQLFFGFVIPATS